MAQPTCPECHAVFGGGAVSPISGNVIPERHTVNDVGKPCSMQGQLATVEQATAALNAQLVAIQAQIQANLATVAPPTKSATRGGAVNG
jgi:hypothetical protein